MVKFLVKRPIAVSMIVLAVSVLGIIAFLTMPVSLLPDIDIPKIKVRVNYPGIDARNLENTVVKPLRQQLMQVGGLAEIESETSDGFSEIELSFSHSVSIEYAYIEVNEKVDAITNRFPREMDRPTVIKVKPSDIPVFYVSISPSENFYRNGKNFIELSEYAESVVKRRFEQFSDVSMVDISGISYPQIILTPVTGKLENLGLTYSNITAAIKRNNIEFGSLSFRDGHYVYRLRFKPSIKTVDDFKVISLSKNGRMFKLGDLAEIKLESNTDGGMFFHNESRAISMAVYKQADARMQDISKSIEDVITNLKSTNPDIDFVLERDQTKLLSYSLNNLKQTLLLGILLAMVIMFLFIKGSKLPFIVSISIPVSLIISFFFLSLSGISINIISLSGLILSVGLMIDNSIIVIDNINQYRLSGKNTLDATIVGTNEVIRPLISSVLTTCAVFVPMIALSGIAGAIFYDQAVTITISLIISLFVSIMVIPVLYKLIVNNSQSTKPVSNQWLLSVYEKSLSFVMRRRVYFSALFFLLIPVGFLLFTVVEKEKFPQLEQNDLMVTIEWNEAVSLSENKHRTLEFIDDINVSSEHTSSYIGKNQFTLTEGKRQLEGSAMIYLNFDSIINIVELSNRIRTSLTKQYPLANIQFSPSENIFQTIFSPNNTSIVAKFRHDAGHNITPAFVDKIDIQLSGIEMLNINKNISLHPGYEIYPKHDNLLLYNLNLQSVIQKLEVLFGGSVVDKVSSGNKVINVIIHKRKNSIYETLATETVKNEKGIDIPLNAVLDFKLISNLRTIKSDKQGEYYSISIESNNMDKENIEDTVIHSINPAENIEVSFMGNAYEQEILFKEFMFVLGISLILLYLILAAQFESLLLPIIILTEILFDISGALLFLYIFQSSLNLMSALGIIIMSGIIINDSIIKIDTIRQSHKSGRPLLEAIFEGGRRRFYPIVMTSLTTILALVPLLIFGGLGVELQIPLALSIIGGLLLGTVVSLFFIPIMYYYLAYARAV